MNGFSAVPIARFRDREPSVRGRGLHEPLLKQREQRDRRDDVPLCSKTK